MPIYVHTHAQSLSCVQLFATPWTVAHPAPLSLGFPRQEYWSVLPFPSPGHLPDPGVKPGSPASQVGSVPAEPPGELVYIVKLCSELLVGSGTL